VDQGEERTRQVVRDDLGRYRKVVGASGNGGELLHCVVTQVAVHGLFMQVDATSADQGREERLVLLDMPDETQTGQKVIGGLFRGREVLLVEQAEDPCELTLQHVLFAPELSIKGGATDVSPVDDLLHGDAVVPLLLQQREQCVDDKPTAAPRPPIRLHFPHRHTFPRTVVA
jgi:hypothetical protein